jgi:hypothetical protein
MFPQIPEGISKFLLAVSLVASAIFSGFLYMVVSYQAEQINALLKVQGMAPVDMPFPITLMPIFIAVTGLIGIFAKK